MRNYFQFSIFFVVTAALIVLSGCSINVKKDSNDKDENKKVDIDTPFGGIHVSKGADVHDTGLPGYPGAKPKTKGDSDDDEKSANVDISTSSFGVKVVAIQYERCARQSDGVLQRQTETVRQCSRMPHFRQELQLQWPLGQERL